MPKKKSASAQIDVNLVGEIKKLLSAARRTLDGDDREFLDRFVEPRLGLIDQLMAQANHLIEGRRGTGKSTILQVLRHRAQESGIPVAFVDMERHKQRSYPDVLVELLIDVLDALRPDVPKWNLIGKQRKSRREFDKAIDKLRSILDDPESISRNVQRGSALRQSSMAEAKARASVQNDSSSTASVALGSESKNESSRSWEESGSLVLTKIERLRNLAPALSKLLADLVSQTSAQQSIVFIDDFYYIRTSDQAYVLDYLHQVCKGTNVWIKICGVGTRLRPYRDDDPPVGMEPENDIFRLSLDLTLEDFVTAKRFLEKVMDGILGSKGTVESFLSDTARDRIILASGGAVVRDYINLVDDALDIALRDKQKKDPGSSSFRIGAEHINTAASKRLDKKEEEDLAADAQEDHSSLRERWHHVLKFSRSKENTQFVLFRQDQLSETKWGAQVQQLQNLRLLHRITTAVPNTENWRGIKTVVVMIDLATAARQRLNQEVIPFWQGQAQMDRLRRAEWVYSPDFDRDELPSRTSSAKKKAPDTKAPTPTRDVGFQASLLDNGSGEDGR